MIHLVDTRKGTLSKAVLTEEERGDMDTKAEKQPRTPLDQKRLENLTDEQKIKAFDNWNSKTTFVHPEDPYPPTLRGLATARLHCRFEMGKILDEVSEIISRTYTEKERDGE